MNQIAIIFPRDGWILQRMGEQLAAYIPNAMTFRHDDPAIWVKNGPLDQLGQINYFINYAVMQRPTAGIDVALFTHPEDRGQFADLFWEIARQVDMPICMTKKYAEELRTRGIDSAYIIPGVDPQFKPKLYLAFIGRYNDFSTNRKGADFIERLSRLPYVEIIATQGQIPADQLPSIYQCADYTLVTSRYEGGPMCLLESLACGRKVIIPKDVGLACHFPDQIIPYDAGNYESLKTLVDKLFEEKCRLAKAVAPYTWDAWAEAHVYLFAQLREAASSSEKQRCVISKELVIGDSDLKNNYYQIKDSSTKNMQIVSKKDFKNLQQPNFYEKSLPRINLYAIEHGLSEINLHLGCGGFHLDGWINIDNYDFDPADSSRHGAAYDIKMDIRSLEVQSDSVEKILLVHVLEHFVRWEAIELLRQFYQILKPGGSLIMEHPDLDQCIKFYQNRKEIIQTPIGDLNIGFTQFYGNQWDKIDYETHRYVWTKDEINKVLHDIGFNPISITNQAQFHVPDRDMFVTALKPIIGGKVKRVVFTALFGNYETLNEQSCLNREGIDFICLTDSAVLSSATWKVIRVATTRLDATRESRRPKILAHEYFSDYDESLYIDNTVILKYDPVDIFLNFLPVGTDLCCFQHPWRNCLYQEAEVVKVERMDDADRVNEQMNYYRHMGYPVNNGLIAGTFLLRRHNAEAVIKTMEFWFDQVLRYSKRDQLSFNFSAWVCKFDFVAMKLNLTDNPIMQWPIYNNRKTTKAQLISGENITSSLDLQKTNLIDSEKNTKPQESQHYIWQSLGGDAGKREEFYMDNPRSEIVKQFEHAPRRVLEIGCATGATGKFIKELFPNAWIAGIELSEVAAKIAATRLDVVINKKFEESNPENYGITESSIDTVILADVLEHMYDPWHVLVRLRPYLTPDAQVLASIPNINNLWLMNELAHGRFGYETMGLLDITHIRFFTHSEINKLFQETGYRVAKVHRNLDSRLTHIQCYPGTHDIETEKLVLKDVTPEELLDLKTLQFVVLAHPADELEKTNAANRLVSIWLAKHIWGRERCYRLLDSCKANQSLQSIHIFLMISAQKNLPVNTNEDGVDQPSNQPSFNPSQFKLLDNILSDLNEQVLANWRLTVFSEFPCSDLRFASSEVIEWVQTTSSSQTDAMSAVAMISPAEWFMCIPTGIRLSPSFTLLTGLRLSQKPDTLVLYTDEDIVNAEGEYSQPKLKPDINIELLRSSPSYIGAAILIRKSLMLDPRIAILPPGLSRNYGAALLAIEQGFKTVDHFDEVLVHVPEILVDEYSGTPIARFLVEQHLTRCKIAAEIHDGTLLNTLFVDYQLPVEPLPMVSIIISIQNRLDSVQSCLESLLEKTDYTNFEVLVIDYSNIEIVDPTLQTFFSKLSDRNSRVRVIRCSQTHNNAAIKNFAARQAQGEFLLLLDNDTIILQENWLTRLTAIGICKEVGVVGCRLVSVDQRLKHAGLILGLGGTVGPINVDLPMTESGYMGRAQLTQDFSAVSANCMLIRKDLYFEVGGFDEKKFPKIYYDADFCLKLGELGYRTVWTPFVTLAQQNKTDSGSKQDVQQEHHDSLSRKTFIKKWLSRLSNDPAYNRHLSLRQTEWMIDGDFDVPWHPNLEPLPRIVAQAPDQMGVGQYRLIGPLKELTSSGRICSFLLPALSSEKRFLPYISELVRVKPTVLFLQNAFTHFHFDDLQSYAESLPDVFRVFGQDDIVFSVPQKSSARKHFGKDTKARVRKAVGLCHRAIVTTESIAEAMRGMVDDIRVVPNYLERSRWGNLQPPKQERRKLRVGWAGAQQHQGDLEFILPVVEATANEVDWIFMGMCPPKLRYHVAEVYNAVPFDQYPAALAALDLDLAIAPLEINRFNTAKSNLRLLEYGAVGYPVIATDILPYRNAPVTRVPNNPKAWIDAIRAHVHDLDATRAAGEQLREWVLSHWMLDQHLDEWMKALLPD